MLAQLPGVRVLGEEADPIGRVGIAVEFAGTGDAEEGTQEGAQGGAQGGAQEGADKGAKEDADKAALGEETTPDAAEHFVIDRQTGELLAEQSVALRDLPLIPKGTVLSSTIYEQAWTNQTPEPSPGCSDGS
jgi:hypothetical protein